MLLEIASLNHGLYLTIAPFWADSETETTPARHEAADTYDWGDDGFYSVVGMSERIQAEEASVLPPVVADETDAIMGRDPNDDEAAGRKAG